MDAFVIHEALDRTHLISGMIQDYLLESPAILDKPHLHQLALLAMNNLEEIYQAIPNVYKKEYLGE